MDTISFEMLSLESQNLLFWWTLVLLMRPVWPLCLWVYNTDTSASSSCSMAWNLYVPSYRTL